MEIKHLDHNFDPRFALSDSDSNVYLLMDGARFKNIHAFIYQKEEQPEYQALYRGTFFEKASEVSPCLVRVRSMHDGLMPWYVKEGASEKQGMVIVSNSSLKELAAHFQQFLEARLPSMKIVLFRFYDPGVFHAMSHLYKRSQLAAMLKPCSAVYWNIEGVYHCLA